MLGSTVSTELHPQAPITFLCVYVYVYGYVKSWCVWREKLILSFLHVGSGIKLMTSLDGMCLYP